MDKTMVPPQFDSALEILKVSDYPSNNNLEDTPGKLTLKPADQLYDQICDDVKYLNGTKMDITYSKCRELLLASAVVPCEIDVKDGLFAKTSIPKGARYGPFHGKWAGVPQDPRFAWEVSAETAPPKPNFLEMV